MADNPFFPGYVSDKPDNVPNNPLFPGQYPGSPMSRRPSGGGILPSYSYNFDDFFTYIDQFGNDAASLFTVQPGEFLPSWVKERLIDDLKVNLKASILPKNLPPEEAEDYNISNLPGAMGIDISLNPQDWAEDPLEQAKKTAKGWIKNVFPTTASGVLGYGDMDNIVKENIWRQITGLDPDDGSSTERFRFGGQTSGPIEAARDAALGRTTLSWAPTPDLKLLHQTGDSAVDDSYKSAAQSIVDFHRNSTVSVIRDQRYDTALENIVTAAHGELNARFGGGGGLNREQRTSLEMFNKNVAVLNTLGEDGGLAKKYDNFAKELDKIATLSPLANHNDAAKNLISLKTHITESREKVKDAIEFASRNPGTSRSMLKQLESYDAHLQRAESVIGSISPDHINVATAFGMRSKVLGLSTGGVIGVPLGKGTTVTKAIKSGMLRELGENEVAGRFSTGTVRVADISNQHNLVGKKFISHVNRMAADRDSFAFEEVAQAALDGKLLERYVWNKIKTKYEMLTPGYWAAKGLERTQFFGLKIDEGLLEKSALARNLGLFKKDEFGNIVHAPGAIFGNNFKMQVKLDEREHGPIANVALFGGKHFEFITKDLDKLRKLGLTDNQLAIILSKGTNLQGNAFAGHVRLALSHAGVTDAVIAQIDENTISRLKALQNWAGKNKNLKKIPLQGEESVKFWEGFLGGLSARQKLAQKGAALGITTRYAGLLEKLLVELNKIQNAIFSKFGKFIAPISAWKSIIADKIATYATFIIQKALAVFLGAASAGLGVIAAKFLGPLIKFATKKVLDYVQAFVGGLFKGDIFAALKLMEKEITNLLKVTLYAMMVPMSIIALILYLIHGVILTTLSPVDPTKSNSGYRSDWAGWPPGENKYVKVEKDVRVTSRNSHSGYSATNPTDPVPNSEVDGMGINVEYTVTITPKITLPANTVTFTDIAIHTDSEGNSRRIIEEEEIPLPVFNAGESITIPIPGPADADLVLNGGEYHDSLILNVAVVNLPAIGEDPESSVSFPRAFRIGNFVGDCPINEPYGWMTTSYTAPNGVGHGTNSYWRGIAGVGPNDDLNPLEAECFAIPYVWSAKGCGPGNPRINMCTPVDANSICTEKYNGATGYPWYGYALDVMPVPQQSVDVYLPALNDRDRQWTITDSNIANNSGSWGYGLIATSEQYKIYFTHMNSGLPSEGSVLPAGTRIGSLYTGAGWGYSQIHLHVELIDMEDNSAQEYITAHNWNIVAHGTPLKPEDHMCRNPVH